VGVSSCARKHKLQCWSLVGVNSLVWSSLASEAGYHMMKLKGKNQIAKFRQVAERLASDIASHEGVAGIVFLGGLVRGFADRFSDLDMTVFLDREDKRLKAQIYKISSDEAKRSGVEVDLMIHCLGNFRRWKWDEADRWELSKAEIVYDPKGEIRKVFDEKLTLPKDLWTRRIAVYAEYLKWYACPPKRGIGTIAESWIERGDLVSAHYCLSYPLDLLIRLVFALNKEFLAPPKWRIHYSYNLKWLPTDYRRLVEEAMIVKSLSIKDFSRRLEVIQKLWNNMLPKIKDVTGMEREQLSKCYVEKILRQTAVSFSH
jgi:predicted nucleotidyltransferase